MRKTISFLILAILSLTLFGCDSPELIDHNLAPVINANEGYNVEVNDEDFDITSFVYVEDDLDGTSFIDSSMIDLKDFDITTVGSYDVEITVTDSTDTKSVKTITINVVDTTLPTIKLIGDEEVSVMIGDTYEEEGVTLSDNYDTSLTLSVNGTVDTSKTGDYELEYYTEDSSGNKSVSVFRTVKVFSIDPAAALSNVKAVGNSITFDLSVIDNAKFGEFKSIELYDGDTVIDSLSDVSVREFTGLDTDKTYKIFITYSYTLSDTSSDTVILTLEVEIFVPAVNLIDESGFFITKDEVALYIYTYGKLPSNYMTKSEAGGHISSHWTSTNMASIGGDSFGNREGLLPSASGRTYIEVDIDYHGASSRGTRRIVYSSDGFIFYTGNHYSSFVLYDPETGEWNNYSKNDAIFDN